MAACCKFFVLGHPVGHSLSPAMHTANFTALGFAGTYAALDVPPEKLSTVVRQLATTPHVRGFNCTIPHKEAMLALVDEVDVTARTCGAVNTVLVTEEGRLVGYNTDCLGFLLALQVEGISLEGRPVVLLGAGGAARALAVACCQGCPARGIAPCAALTIVNRTLARAEDLAAVLSTQGYVSPITVSTFSNLRLAEDALIINATSVGLRVSDPSILPETSFKAGQMVCDIMPVQRETATLAAARVAGARTLGGLGMLVHQGAEAFRIWTGLEPNVPALYAACLSGAAGAN